jgi:methionyl aminopeptidase
MSYVKTQNEIQHIRVACRIAAEILAQVIAAAKAGVSTAELDALAEKLCQKNKVDPSFKGYLDYPASTCISVNEQIVHGLPGDRTLQKGDIVGVDFGVRYRGYFSDVARTIAIGSITQQAKELIQSTKQSLELGIAQVRPGNRLGDIGHAIQTYAEKKGYGVVRELVGHGVGTAVHEPPAVPNYGRAKTGETLVPGMVLALEPMLNQGSAGVRLMDDGWTYVTKDGSLSAHFEDTVLVTERGHEVLTRF